MYIDCCFTGTHEDPAEVQTWTSKDISHHHITPSYHFEISYPYSTLLRHDQDLGKTYFFSIKVFNRAGLSSVFRSETYTLHSQIKPTTGKVLHVSDEDPELEIGYQAVDDVLCVSWEGFTHHREDVNVSIGIGTKPGEDDVVAQAPVENLGYFCFDGLQLNHLMTYYFKLTAHSIIGEVVVNSNGIFVATEEEVVEQSNIRNGPGCQGEWEILQPTGNEYSISSDLPPEMMITAAVRSPNHHDVPGLSSAQGEIKRYAWVYEQDSLVNYYRVDVIQPNQTATVTSPYNVTVSKSVCLMDQGIQPSSDQIRSSWTFRPEVLQALSHYQVDFEEHQCTSQGCSSTGVSIQESYVTATHHKTNVPLKRGHSYRTSVQACFGPTCVSAVSSGGITVNPDPAVPGQISCIIQPQYMITATWEAFKNAGNGFRLGDLRIYDWCLTTASRSQLIPWQRLVLPANQSVIEVWIFSLMCLFPKCCF